MRYLLLSAYIFLCAIKPVYSFPNKNKNVEQLHQKDTSNIPTVETTKNTSLNLSKLNANNAASITDSMPDGSLVNPKQLALYPAVSLQQFIKGKFAGLNVQEATGEPGSVQNMFIRGAALPLLSPKDVYQVQPLVVLDGIPMVTEHPFAYDIQQYDFNRIGPATNIYANIDMDNIESVEVLKDAGAIAIYGPRAINGVIVLKTKPTGTTRHISFNSYVGLAQKPQVTTINGSYENSFRQRFYDLYTPNGRYSDDETYPNYLSDSLNSAYYGPSNWNDQYYKNGLVYSVNAAISGGSDKANFRFSIGNLKNEGVADATAVNRYSTMFNINMKPVNWLLFSVMVNANRVERDRNKSLRDRFTQMNYFPDLSSPLSPNKSVYSAYLANYKNGFDNNKTNIIEGYTSIGVHFGRFNITSRLAIDYNEGYRDLFYSRPLMQNTSYASNYYGFNQRLILKNTATYDVNKANQTLHIEAGQSVEMNTYKYSNGYAYKGVNDYIKINLLESDPNNGNYLNPLAFPKELTFRFLDKTRDNLFSLYAKGDYTFKNVYSLTAVLRADASTNAQPTSKWFYSPTLAATWNVKKDFLNNYNAINALSLKASAGRIGRINTYDNYAAGPQYMASVGYTGNPTVPGYNAFSVLTRPYSFGWVGYGIPWSYSDQFNFGLDGAILNNRLRFSVDAYSKTEKDLLLSIPAHAEYGYQSSIESGMSINNSGIEAMISGDIIAKTKKLSWTSSVFINFNKNKLKSLPKNLSQIVIGDRLLKVGQSVDQYWVLINQGKYTSNKDIPVVNGVHQKYNGIPLMAGDPIWKDVNGDNVINDDDKVLKGHSLPVATGGFDNTFSFGKFDVGINVYFDLGRKLINKEMANRFDFINREGQSNLSSIKEITFWEKRGDYSKYPLYNPWSPVIPYRLDQDLFLENASFVKLRTISLGYDLTNKKANKQIFNRVYLYGAINNLLTLTKYTGQDPELVNYTGYDSGYGMRIPVTYSLGIKVELL